MSSVIEIDNVLQSVKPAPIRFPLSLSSNQEWVSFSAKGHELKESNRGVSAVVEGFKLFVCHVKTGRVIQLAAEATSSWSGIWSPNGKTLAFFSDLNGVAQLWLWHAETESLSLASETIVRPFFGFETPIWTHDGNGIIVKVMPKGDVNNTAFNMKSVPKSEEKKVGSTFFSTEMDEEQLENDRKFAYYTRYHADIARIDWRTKQTSVIASNHYAVGISLSEDGQNIAFTSCKGLEQIDDGQVIYDLWTAPVYPNGVNEEVCLQERLQMEYGLSFTWGKNHQEIYYTTGGPLSDCGLWSIQTNQIGQRTQLFQQDQLSLGRDYEAPFIVENGDVIVVAAGKLWRFIQKSREMIEVSAQLEKHVDTFIPKLVKSSTTNEDQCIIVQTLDKETERAGFAFINIENGAVEKLIEDAKKFTSWSIGNDSVSTQNAPMLAFISESASETPNIWRWNLHTNETKQITDLASGLTSEMGETRVLKWQVGDVEARGVLLLPKGCQQKVPVMLDVYAGQDVWGSINTFGLNSAVVDNRLLFSSRGYAVFRPELPIHSHEPADEIERGLVAALEALAKCPEVDMDRLGILGHSFGGYTTLVAITRLPERFKTAISHSGICDLVNFTTYFDQDNNYFNYDWAEHGQANLGVSIWENKERYIRNSPIFDFDKIEAPLLIIQGSKDSICGTQAGPIFSALKRLEKTAELVLYDEDHWHGAWDYENVKDYYERLFRWLETYL